MQNERFARRLGDVDWSLRPAPQLVSVKDKYLRDWKLVKRARFNAAKRFERKQSASTLAFAIAGVVGFLVPVYCLLFKDVLASHTKSVLEFTSFVTGGLSLTLGLIEQAKDYPARARWFDECGRKVNRVLRRLMTIHVTSDAELLPLIEEYERALEECADNHDDIDYDIAKASEDLAEAQSPLGIGAARKKLAKLKLREAMQIYWLYAATWVTPVMLGLGLYFFVTPPPP